MQNALQEPQTIVLLGGTSEIGRAIVDELASEATRTIVLGCRRPEEAHAEHYARDGREIVAEHFDAAATENHESFIRRMVAEHGDLDVVIVAFGVLGDQADFDHDPTAAAAAVHVNYTGAVTVSLAVAAQMRRQGHGQLVVVSSVAGERARSSNYVYGSSKAGLDAFAQGLGDALQGSGASVTVIRPGFVHSRMTRGMKSAPFATTPRVVGELAAEGIRKGRHTVWTPGVLRYVFMILRHVPRPIFRRLPI
ncbi:MAG: decaprenylphospho-beta-D-erythro-pentofuranosid-2-ulose 2-reductase [Ilumatobacter sp.]|uniref:decaprenylphospho-beta-D-erythro-pentofuranosid- 2-ulose 2-reductase n=1 Tax=Ilumatobacter sp. TaxID=1967498 RepID=UPI00261F91AF|nr:decaprenylphospho-beta-D-erythro-pentofuranosid-2-ulose 2-reductase [Ilumatobacter sp.]MDJ0767320.1 decaprenylphospho-beta-D-erythro-pentofuranosid-2-ulose 2-reductase [Ilumatobacter sp.]